MDALSHALLPLGPWAWVVLAVVMLVLELTVPGLHFIWFGLAALVVGVVALAGIVGVAGQVALFGLVSLGMIVAVRFVFGPRIAVSGDTPELNERGLQYLGRIVTVEDAISGGRGRVRVGDTLWLAQGPDAPRGASVKVTGLHGTVLIVEKA
jgi:membrane protein implicated in regulation of membrane protease activity